MRTLTVPGDKSLTHRALLFAALATGQSRLRGLALGGDAQSTARALRALGVKLDALNSDELVLEGVGLRGLRASGAPLDCGNSGTSARLLMGVIAGLPIEAVFTGDDSLRSRPMRRVTEPLQAMGARVDEMGNGGRLPMRIEGGELRPLTYESPHASAQVKSALLLAGLTAGVRVDLTEPTRTRDHTERMLAEMGATLSSSMMDDGRNRVAVEPVDALTPLDATLPGDPSSAAFLIAAAILGVIERLRVARVCVNPTRTGFLEAIAAMGAPVELADHALSGGEPIADLIAMPASPRAIHVRGEVVPRMIDELPALAMLAARAEGTTVIRDAAELRVKECDRISVLVENLCAIGVKAEELPDGLVITGTDRPLSGVVAAHDDHRIAMAFGILAAQPQNSITIDRPDIAAVSFPEYWNILRSAP